MINKIKLNCLNCKKDFLVWPYQVRNNRKFCSYKCYWENATGQIKNPQKVTGTKLYHIWAGMKRRCNNRNDVGYPRYGGRGIKILWKDFQEFKNNMEKSFNLHINKFGKQNTTIDRIDNDGHYCKKNCRWATTKQQARNRKTNTSITYKGQTMSITEWAEKLDMSKEALYLRLFRKNRPHWSIHKTFNTPIRKTKNQAR